MRMVIGSDLHGAPDSLIFLTEIFSTTAPAILFPEDMVPKVCRISSAHSWLSLR